MKIVTNDPTIEGALDPWRAQIGILYEAYRGHVYRMYNYCLQFRRFSEEERGKLAIAACFHDIGIWTADTLDYIPPSIVQAEKYLMQCGLDDWCDEVGLMIALHHKPFPYREERFPLVEVFRKGDLVDVSLGLVRFGIRREYVRRIKSEIPSAGFHRFLLRAWFGWVFKHPLNPFPFVRSDV